MNEFVATSGHSSYIHWSAGLDQLIHYSLVLVQGGTYPQIVVLLIDRVVCRERKEGCHSLEPFEFVRELIFNEDTALWRTEVGSTLMVMLIVERLVDDPNPRSLIHAHSYHARDVMKMAFSETFGTVQRVNPYDHLIFEELVWELIEIPISLCRDTAI